MSFERRHAPLKHDHAASEITYDNTTSGLTAEQVQAAIDELAAGAGGGGYPEQLAYAGIF